MVCKSSIRRTNLVGRRYHFVKLEFEGEFGTVVESTFQSQRRRTVGHRELHIIGQPSRDDAHLNAQLLLVGRGE